MASVEREGSSTTDEGEREEGEREEEGGEREEGRGEEGGEEKVKKSRGTREGEREGETKKKKQLPAVDSEDDEPPPPYSPTDPQEKKSKQGPRDNIPSAEPPRKSSSADVKPDTLSKTAREGDRRGSLSPLQLSRISSPPRGLSLSELTRVTPEDQERWRQSRESLERERSHESLTEFSNRSSLPRSRFGGSLELHASHRVQEVPTQRKQLEGDGCGRDGRGPDEHGRDGRDQPLLPVAGTQQDLGGDDHTQVESSSDTTLVGSQSQSDTGVASFPESDEKKKEKKKVSVKLQPRLEPVGKKKKSQRSPKASRSKKGNSSNTAEKTATLTVQGYSHVSVCIVACTCIAGKI